MSDTGLIERTGARLFHSRAAGFFFTNAWYSLVTRLDRNAEATFLNYGFAALDGTETELTPTLERDRFAIQLYHHVASRGAVRDNDVLEVGCGRGGGASYIAAAFAPRRYVGVDVNRTAIRFDQRFYRRQRNLEFVAGDAHAIPFGDGTFDVVVNVESSHHYHDLDRFLAEVHRVLKPGGTFLMACFPRASDPALLQAAVGRSSFACVLQEDITANVVRALEIDSTRREAMVARVCPPPLRMFAREFAGVRGSKLYDFFASGNVRYLNFVLRKPLRAA